LYLRLKSSITLDQPLQHDLRNTLQKLPDQFYARFMPFAFAFRISGNGGRCGLAIAGTVEWLTLGDG
jgi:hypothetical protein